MLALMIAEVIYFAENSLKTAHIHITIFFGRGKLLYYEVPVTFAI
ncbi:hypothetical protein lpa_04218 [Legionella pneumophila 2300/99 Alcoy]|nr:hypothetical protein lpa_04218 [Legionella pneumophila 2300/99 Alcoy]